MLRIAICDDILQELQNLVALTAEFLAAHNPEAEIVKFSHPDALLTAIETVNGVKVPVSFIEALAGANDWSYYVKQAKAQYLDNPDEKVDVVVFGHTHVPEYHDMNDGKYFLNDGTWIDHNTDYPEATRTFAVITTSDKDTASLYQYGEDGSVVDIAASVSK